MNEDTALTPYERHVFAIFCEERKHRVSTALRLRVGLGELKRILETIDAKLDKQLRALGPVVLKPGQHAMQGIAG